MAPVVSSGLHTAISTCCMRAAEALDAKLIRFALTPILCGDRNAAGDSVAELVANRACQARRLCAARGRGGRDARRSRTTRISPAASWSAFCERVRAERAHRLRHRQQLSGGRSAARFHPRDRALCRATSISRTTACNGPTRACGWCAAPSATARCRSRNWSPSSPSTMTRLTGSAGAGGAGGAARAPVHARLVARLSAAGCAKRSPPACSRRAATACRRRGLSHAVGAQADGELVRYELDMIRRSAANMKQAGIMQEKAVK